MAAIDQPTADTYSRLWAHLRPESSRLLLLAALDAFAARGFQGATTRDIATRAGMSPAAVYVHYRSKTDLLYEIIRTGHERLWADVSDAMDGREGPAERLRAFAESFATFHARFHTLARVAQYELGELSEEQLAVVIAVRRRIEGLVHEELRRGVDQGIFEVEELHGTTIAILSLGVDVARWYEAGTRRASSNISKLYGDLTLRMVRPSGGAPAPPPAHLLP